MDDENNFQLFLNEMSKEEAREEDKINETGTYKGSWNAKRQNYWKENSIKQKVFVTELKEINVKVFYR